MRSETQQPIATANSASPERDSQRGHRWLAVAAVVVVALPGIVFGPWLPLLDLVAFVGLANPPASMSFGPIQYTVFQFTYIGHYAMSRILLSLGIGPAWQVVFFYTLQAVICTLAIWRIVTWFVSELWLASLCVAIGIAAFWDGLFLWGGPLPFSLAATTMTIATVWALREATDPEPVNPLVFPLLSLLSMLFHPFAAPFVLEVAVIRAVFVSKRRLQTIGLIVAVLLFAWVIRRESPEEVSSTIVGGLLANPFTNFRTHFSSLFTWDITTTRMLFGFLPPTLAVYFGVIGTIHLVGFVTSPFVAFFAQENRALRMLAVLNLAVAVLYFCSFRATHLVPQWSSRILAWHAPFTFAAGVCGPIFLFRRWLPQFFASLRSVSRLAWAAPAIVVALIIAGQAPVLRLSGTIARNLAHLRDEISNRGIANCFVVVDDIRGISPYYLRCVPFLLASEPKVVAKNITLFTEWHMQSRHATRLAETMFDLGRREYEVAFATTADGIVGASFKEIPKGQLALPTGLYQGEDETKPNIARRSLALGDQLLALGCARDAAKHYEAAIRLAPNFAEAQQKLGVAQFQDARLAEAVESFTAVLKSNPTSFDTECNLADALGLLGRSQEALRHYEKAHHLMPGHPRARAGLQKYRAASP